jgi:hypothetical protein
MNRPGDASNLTDEERAAWVERVRATFAEKRARGEAASPPSADETLAELEQDANAGRVVKWDVRCSPEEKLAWSEAARAMGLTQSGWARDVMNVAAAEVLAADDALSDDTFDRAIGIS